MKTLVTAQDIYQAHQTQQTRLVCPYNAFIVTAEARMVAEKLGILIEEELTVFNVQPVVMPNVPTSSPAPVSDIEQMVLKALPKAQQADTALVAQLVEKVKKEITLGANTTTAVQLQVADYVAEKHHSGIKIVKKEGLNFGHFEGAGPDNAVGLVDVIGKADGSSIAAGFMRWQHGFFPWTLTYDEVDYIIEGELHVKVNGQTLVAKAGEVIFIPKNTTIEFGTPTQVHFFYVAYPANWTELI